MCVLNKGQQLRYLLARAWCACCVLNAENRVSLRHERGYTRVVKLGRVCERVCVCKGVAVPCFHFACVCVGGYFSGA